MEQGEVGVQEEGSGLITMEQEEEGERELVYIAYPIEEVSTYIYQVRLTILNITQEVSKNSHKLRVTNKLSSSDKMEIEFEFSILVDFAPLVPSSTSLVIALVVIFIVILVAIIIAIL